MYVAYEWVLPSAFILDLLIGDPRALPHPVRWMGKEIDLFERCARKLPFRERILGGLLVLILVGSTWAICTLAVRVAYKIQPLAFQTLHIILIFYSLSVRSLWAEAMKVYTSLKANDIAGAKKDLSMVVGRDVTLLDETNVIRATVETVAENLVDGIVAPLFYAAIGGGPLAMAYKMVNTMDSMIGYRDDKYKKLGWFAARLDDVANFIPARLSVVAIASATFLIRRPVFRTVKTVLRDGHKHLSPNAGIPEAAFAGTLGIRLGGPNFYGGDLVQKPYIGKAMKSIEQDDIIMAVNLMSVSAINWFLCCWGARWILAAC